MRFRAVRCCWRGLEQRSRYRANPHFIAQFVFAHLYCIERHANNVNTTHRNWYATRPNQAIASVIGGRLIPTNDNAKNE